MLTVLRDVARQPRPLRHAELVVLPKWMRAPTRSGVKTVRVKGASRGNGLDQRHRYFVLARLWASHADKSLVRR